ncbi:MAG: hypothetical protein LBN39_07615 [Planctomycetaceae bacterium]|jgi:mannose-6-phosphate isomerase-like protein (cupin superfamily)|nr:hypothetical protein [Planctomycetaceae bacterium]
MPQHIPYPVRFRDSAVQGDEIQEYIGKISTGNTGISVGLLSFPAGWNEPPQTPDFDEYVCVYDGELTVATEYNEFHVEQDKGLFIPKGERIQYSTGKKNVQYLAVCTPAFAPELTHRENEGQYIETQKPDGKHPFVYSERDKTWIKGKCFVFQEYFGTISRNAKGVSIARILAVGDLGKVFSNAPSDQYYIVRKGSLFVQTRYTEFTAAENQGVIIRKGEEFQCRPLGEHTEMFFVSHPAIGMVFE